MRPLLLIVYLVILKKATVDQHQCCSTVLQKECYLSLKVKPFSERCYLSLETKAPSQPHTPPKDAGTVTTIRSLDSYLWPCNLCPRQRRDLFSGDHESNYQPWIVYTDTTISWLRQDVLYIALIIALSLSLLNTSICSITNIKAIAITSNHYHYVQS